MKIATFNINGINQRIESLLRWLAASRPDVVCLQELKAVDHKFPLKVIRDAGYGAIWHGQSSWNGVAILARGFDPIETRRGLPGAKDDPQGRYLEAAVNGVIVGCLTSSALRVLNDECVLNFTNSARDRRANFEQADHCFRKQHPLKNSVMGCPLAVAIAHPFSQSSPLHRRTRVWVPRFTAERLSTSPSDNSTQTVAWSLA